jgi:hypothetical protein
MYYSILKTILIILKEIHENNELDSDSIFRIADHFEYIENLASTPLNEILSNFKENNLGESKKGIRLLEAFIRKYNINRENIVDVILMRHMEACDIKARFFNHLIYSKSVDDNNKIKIVVDVIKDFLNSNKKENISKEFTVAKRVIERISINTNINREAFRKSKYLAEVFKELVSSFDVDGKYNYYANKRDLGIKLLIKGLVSPDYEQVIDKNSKEDGLGTIISKLVGIEYYGRIIKFIDSGHSNFNKKDYLKILKYSIEAMPRSKIDGIEFNDSIRKIEYLDFLMNKCNCGYESGSEDTVSDRIQYVKNEVLQ